MCEKAEHISNLTLNLRLPTGGSAYGIPWKATNVRPFLDVKVAPSSSPCSIRTLCVSVEYTAFSVSVAQINNNLASIVHSVRYKVSIYMYFLWRLSLDYPFISLFDLQYTYIILSLLSVCLCTTCTKRETRSPRTEMQQVESKICSIEFPLSVLGNFGLYGHRIALGIYIVERTELCS